ncbi:hypothetical protein BDN71DRAFT_1445779 [Pleurotus eryngii]|uniref:Ankyrin repeat protein n=1 Tax=Pleurotus eryngii TaxID=5323 RepID=A0A9P6DGK8_PLEER|nr:hypothetical protein BDN71DRAFT_1445779 [Pleurotus eryngii]
MRRRTGLASLPVELLYEIQLCAASENLPLICKHFHAIYSSTPSSFRARYIIARALRATSGQTKLDIVSRALQYPICSQPVLDAICRQAPKYGISLQTYRPKLPKQLFYSLHPPASRSAPRWEERDHPLPFLRYLYSSSSFPAPDPDSHDGYALTKAVHARFTPLVEFLLEQGASPRCKNGLAVYVAIRMNNIAMVKMLVERDGRQGIESVDGAQNSNTQTDGIQGTGDACRVGKGKLKAGKKRKLEDRIQVTSEMLRAAVKSHAKEVIDWLIEEKGCVPDMQTLLLLTR